MSKIIVFVFHCIWRDNYAKIKIRFLLFAVSYNPQRVLIIFTKYVVVLLEVFLFQNHSCIYQMSRQNQLWILLGMLNQIRYRLSLYSSTNLGVYLGFAWGLFGVYRCSKLIRNIIRRSQEMA